MGFLDWFRKPRGAAALPAYGDPDLAWLNPPADPSSAAGWDEYWNQQMAHGLGPQWFDMFCDDRQLVQSMRQLEGRHVLCAGNGISMEPRALAAAGFHVVALDLSASALEIARSYPPSQAPFETFLDAGAVQSGGQIEWCVGDIGDHSICPGPFDLIIERRTVQNFQEPKQSEYLERLIARLAEDGVYYAHCHDGCWRPPAPPRHVVGDWFRAKGWTFWDGALPKPPGRVVWMLQTTG